MNIQQNSASNTSWNYDHFERKTYYQIIAILSWYAKKRKKEESI